MTKMLIAAITALMGLAAQAQVSETRKVQDFSGIEASNGIEVVYTESETPSLKVETVNRKDLENIVTERKGRTLKIYTAKEEGRDERQPFGHIRVYVSQKGVTSFRADSGASIKVTSGLTAPEITVALRAGAAFSGNLKCLSKCSIDAQSGAVFEGRVDTDAFVGNLKGGASVKLRGTANTSMITSNTGATLAARDFVTGNADIDAKNSSSVFITVKEIINANPDYSASITNYGKGARINPGNNAYVLRRN